MTDLIIAMRIKGFAKAELLSACLGRDVAADLAALIAQGLASETKIGVKLTPAGQAAAEAAWAAERIDIEADYAAFNPINAAFKALVGRWQVKDGAPNDHSDAAYNGGLLAELDGIDAQIQSLLTGLAARLPRLAQYPRRFSAALATLKSGELKYMAAPIIDSYHTVWFELHEDLIRLAGRSRAAEAAAGHAS
jgi:hypothetical protein